MDSLDFMHFAFGVSALVVAGFLGFALYHLVENLKMTRAVLEDTHDVTSIVGTLKSFFISKRR